MSYETEGTSSSNRTVLIIVAIVAVVVLVVVLVCAGVVYLLFRSMSEGMSKMMDMVNDLQMSQVTAQTFLNDLTVGRIEAAYARTTEGFQARQTLDEFRALLAKNRAFQKQATVMVHPITMTPGTASFTATISAPDGAATCTVDVIKEGEQWKVDRFIITSGQAK